MNGKICNCYFLLLNLLNLYMICILCILCILFISFVASLLRSFGFQFSPRLPYNYSIPIFASLDAHV